MIQFNIPKGTKLSVNGINVITAADCLFDGTDCNNEQMLTEQLALGGLLDICQSQIKGKVTLGAGRFLNAGDGDSVDDDTFETTEPMDIAAPVESKPKAKGKGKAKK